MQGNPSARPATTARPASDDARREALRLRLTRILTAVCLVSILVAGVATAAYFVKKNRSSNPSSVGYKIGDLTYKMPYESVVMNGVTYLNFTDAARYIGLSMVGDTTEMKYLIPSSIGDSTGTGSEPYVIFYAGASRANVNGTAVSLPGQVLVLDGQMWIPTDFISAHVVGVTVTVSGSSVTVSRDTVKTSGQPDAVVPVAFSAVRLTPLPNDEATTATEPAVTEPITEDPDLAIINHVTFLTDQSSVESILNPQGDQRDAFLVLVNKGSTVTEDFAPTATLTLNTGYTMGGRTVQMESSAAVAMEAMFRELFAAGYTDMHVTSGYRSYADQLKLYNTYVSNEMSANKQLTREAAVAIVDTYSARAGTSEHQSGLCADLHNLSSADKKFAKKEAYTWLCDNAWKFGFILRFPEDKTDVTGYDFEPWHWRFVGRYHAYKIHKDGLCLEEYLDVIDG